MSEGASLEKPLKMDEPEKGSKDVNSALAGSSTLDMTKNSDLVKVRRSWPGTPRSELTTIYQTQRSKSLKVTGLEIKKMEGQKKTITGR